MVNFAAFDLNLLRVFDALLREGSTVRAGEWIGLSQPAVSAALGRLRHALDDPLFVRKGNRLVPTARASKLGEPVGEVLKSLERLLNEPEIFRPEDARLDFRIAGTDFFASMLMPQLARLTQERAPGVRLQLLDLVPDNYVETIDRYELDLALIPAQDFPGWLRHEPVFQAQFAVIARPGHGQLGDLGPGDEMPLERFCRLGHVLCSPEGKFRGIGDAALERAGRSRHVVMSVPVFEGVLRAVAETDLVALIPVQLAKAGSARGDVVIYRPPVAIEGPTLCMAWHSRADRDPAHQWMRAAVRDILRQFG